MSPWRACSCAPRADICRARRARSRARTQARMKVKAIVPLRLAITSETQRNSFFQWLQTPFRNRAVVKVLPAGGVTMQSQPKWREEYVGGSAEAERLAFEKLARDIMSVQVRNMKTSKAGAIQRAVHAKCVLGVTNAKLRVRDDLPPQYRVDYFQPGAEFTATVRLSNANGAQRPDHKNDMRGIAVRLKTGEQTSHDLLATSFPVSHARNATQFVAFAKAAAGSKLLMLPRLLASVGPSEAIRMLRNVIAATRQPCRSMALERFWSRGAIQWGPAGPVRYQFRPAGNPPGAPDPSRTDDDYLRHEIGKRLRAGDIVYDVLLQPYVDEQATPIEDGSIEWTENVSPPFPVATLTIPRQDVDSAEGRTCARAVDAMTFNPWHAGKEFPPLGNLNRARKAVYAASAAQRQSSRFQVEAPLINRIVGKILFVWFKALNTVVPWHKLPWRSGLLNLTVLREQLRAHNLFDTEMREAPPLADASVPVVPEWVRSERTFNGMYNDLSDPKMGCLNSTFGRTMKPVYQPKSFDLPDPIRVSEMLMKRDPFIPARSLNVLAAAWIQFQVHDWVNHKRLRLGQSDIVLPLPEGRTWKNHRDLAPEDKMRIADNEVAHKSPDGYPVFNNITTPWWDGSEVYGDEDTAPKLRAGPRIRLDNGYLPKGVDGVNDTGFKDSWWLGLSALHTLFAREHNAVCEALMRQYPTWDDERVYQTARLIISALIAKIHTVEWTPAILGTKTIAKGLRANWYGAPKDWMTQTFIKLVDKHALKGIPETLPDHHGTPYSLTEEFAAVYRLHPLIPDDYQFFDPGTGQPMETRKLADIQGRRSDAEMRRLTLRNVVYSFGIAHPGAITLHNYPDALRKFERLVDPGAGEIIDLSVVDIVRDRRRGVPRFNDFRAALHKPRIRAWEEFSDDPETVRRIRDLYPSIDMVDTMVGLHAETPPTGFGFSDTAFRVFILMASRRLQSDRFLTVDYRPEIYSPLGLDWIDKTDMTSIILRHCPELATVLPHGASAFAPFRPVAT